MQAKGLVKFFAVTLIAVCLYQLSFTFFTSRVENKAESHAISKVGARETLSKDKLGEFSIAKRTYLDSVSNKSAYPLLGYTYNEVKERQLNLGLDLQGGMSVVLQVTLQELIEKMANNSQSKVFRDALQRAKVLQQNSESDFVTLFGQAFSQVDPNAKLAAIFSTPELRDKIDFNSSNEEVLEVIRLEADEAFDRTFEILRARIDKFGVTQPNISQQKSSGRITVELPGVDDPERVRKLLQATAKLEFWEVYPNSAELGAMLNEANNTLKEKLGIEDEPEEIKEDTSAKADSTNTDGEIDLLGDDNGEGSDSDTDPEKLKRQNPLFAVFQQIPQAGATLGYVEGKDTSKLNRYMAMPEIRSAFPENVKFLLGKSPIVTEDEETILYPIYGMQSRYNDLRAPLEGDAIDDARQDYDMNQQVVVSMQMNAEGGKNWRKLTGENIGKSIAIVLDDVVYSAPVVQSQISGGNSQISGTFSVTEAQDLANILKAGKLPAPARIVEEAVVGPSLGAKSIRNGLLSLVAGILLVLLFMVLYYAGGGWVANIALILNLFLVVGVLASLGATLTLPGMAGIVLTIGMAVDANVIIFERIREELTRGSSIKKAIMDGYSKSYSAIIDANLTTLITAIILYVFGLGPILGFATVLMIGIFSSLFTAILITRLIIDWYLGKGKDISYSTGFSKGLFKNLNIDFISRRKIGYIIAAVIFAIGAISFVTRGFELGVDFKGGRTYVVQFPQDVSTNQVRDLLSAPLEATPLVRTYGGGNQVKITTSYLIDSTDPNSGNLVTQKLFSGLKDISGAVSYDKFISENIQSSQKVGPTIADDIKRGSIKATMLALLGIFLYILLRFRRWQFGLAAVLTIIHDTLILLTLFTVFAGILPFSLEIDQTFIAALLTVIGYSINDTVVVFDRIREYLQLNPKRNEREVINEAINSTLSRTIITSLTTLLVILVLFIFGGEVIRGFSFALLVGVIVGTYSSIFIATPIVVDLSDQYQKRKDAQAAVSGGKKKSKKVKTAS